MLNRLSSSPKRSLHRLVSVFVSARLDWKDSLTDDHVPQHFKTSGAPSDLLCIILAGGLGDRYPEVGSIHQSPTSLVVRLSVLDVVAAGPHWLLECRQEPTSPE